MKYWPLHAVADAMALAGSPYAKEAARIYASAPSEPAFYAIMDMATRMPAVDAPNLVLIETEGAPNVRAFTAFPGSTEWLRLERCAVMQDSDGLLFVHMDVVH